MPTRNELKQLAKTRLQEAKVLFDKGFYDGACYLSGYVVELALKARICKILDLSEYPHSGEISRAYKTHRYGDLLMLSGLERKFSDAIGTNSSLHENWGLLIDWTEEFRYRPIGSSSKKVAEKIINALDNPKDGVFTWIKKRW
jgi:HEPN domain-containing protein